MTTTSRIAHDCDQAARILQSAYPDQLSALRAARTLHKTLRRLQLAVSQRRAQKSEAPAMNRAYSLLEDTEGLLRRVLIEYSEMSLPEIYRDTLCALDHCLNVIDLLEGSEAISARTMPEQLVPAP